MNSTAPSLTLNNSLKIPSIGLGTWLSEDNQVYSIVKEAIKIGYRHIDCATCYGNEKEVGRALQEVIEEGFVKREELFITSKLWNNAHHKEHVSKALEKTLSDLNLEYLDLYLMHWPVAFKHDIGFPTQASEYISLEQLPVIQTYSAMEQLVEQGKVRSIGVSNFSIKKLDDLILKAKIKPVVNQVELHPYLQQNQMIEYCKQNEIILTCYSPLGSSGRPNSMKSQDEPSLLNNEIILDIAKKEKVSAAQVILAWSIQRGTVVIPKTVNPKRAKDNLEAVNVDLSEKSIEDINALDKHFRYVTGEFFMPPGSPYNMANLWDE